MSAALDAGDAGTPATTAAADRALLRRFEPIIRYTRGEQFFPMNVEPYVRESSLWVLRPGADPERLVLEGALTPEKLAEPRADGFGAITYLRFIEPPNLVQLAQYLLERRSEEAKFHPGRGRLARVGYLSRFVAALFSLTLLARGRIPGDTAIAAAMLCHRLRAAGAVCRFVCNFVGAALRPAPTGRITQFSAYGRRRSALHILRPRRPRPVQRLGRAAILVLLSLQQLALGLLRCQ